MVNNSKILNNNISYNRFGVRFSSSHNNNLIAYNYFAFNSAEGIILYYSSNNTITNNYITENLNSVFLHASNFNKLANNTMTENDDGFDVFKSSFNVIENNFVESKNRGVDIRTNSNENEVANNDFSNQLHGVYIRDNSINNVITNNTLNYNYENGIRLENSNYNHLKDNKISFNRRIGIYIGTSKGNILDRNTMIRNGILIGGSSLEYWNTHDIDTSNTVNGKPVHYWKNQTGGVVPQGAGEVILANCNNVIIENQTLTQASYGIQLGYSPNNYIKNNLISSHKMDGIYIHESVQNEFTGNFIVYNWRGILLKDSNDNTFHHNNFLFNTRQVYITNSVNTIWDDSSEGNYWNDYTGLDDGSGGRLAGDGVGDTEIPHPYTNQGWGYYQIDNYPLMNPFGNYIYLHEGWNLISFPMIQGDKNLTTVLEMLDGYYDAVQWYDNTDKNDPWKHYKLDKSYGNDLSEIYDTMSFWIHITQPGDTIFLYNDTPQTKNQTIILHEGWNLVGYPSLTGYNRTEGLNNLTFGQEIDLIQWYDASTQTWHDLGEEDYFIPGKGYWIHAKADCEWEVPL
jgi:parallel beta-helix repeat protein